MKRGLTISDRAFFLSAKLLAQKERESYGSLSGYMIGPGLLCGMLQFDPTARIGERLDPRRNLILLT